MKRIEDHIPYMKRYLSKCLLYMNTKLKVKIKAPWLESFLNIEIFRIRFYYLNLKTHFTEIHGVISTARHCFSQV